MQLPASIPVLIARYRELKDLIQPLDDELKDIRSRMEGLIHTAGDWRDEHGYARIKRRKLSVSYDSKGVENLVQAWIGSDDPRTRDFGQMLIQYRTEKPASEYIEIK